MSYKVDFNLESLLRLKNHQKRVFFIILFNLFVSFFIYMLIPNEFKSYASILPSGNNDSQKSSLASLANQFGYNMNQSTNPLIDPNVIKHIAKNDKLSSKILNYNLSLTNQEPKEIFYLLFPKQDINNEIHFERAKESLYQNIINVYQDLESSIIHFEVTTNDKNLSFEICKLIFEDTISIINDFTSENNIKKLNFLKERNEILRVELLKQQNSLKEFEERNRLAQSPSLQLEISKLITEIQITKSVYVSLRTEEESLSIEVSNTNNGIFLIDSPYLPKDKSFPRLRNLIFLFVFLNLLALSLYVLKNSKISRIDY